MTVQQLTSRSPTYSGDGVEQDYPTDFEFGTAEEIRCFIDGAETVLFSVSGGSGEEGTVTFDTAPADGALVDIIRSTPKTQTLYSAALATPTILEATLDRITRITQSLERLITGSIRAPIYENIDMVLPAFTARANKLLGFDIDGEIALATVGNAQTHPPLYFDIDSATTDYDLTAPDRGSALPANTSITIADLWVDINGWNLHGSPGAEQFEVVNGTTVRLNVDLSEVDGYELQVRIVSYAALFQSVPDGSVDSPAKFANRPVDLAALAIGTPLGVLGYDANGDPVNVPRKYIGETWFWGGQPDALPTGNIVILGQTIQEVDFPDLFAAWGLTGAGSIVFEDSSARLPMIAGQGNTGEGGVLGTARLVRTTGGAETHLQQSNEVGNHPHITSVNASSGNEATDPTDRLARLGAIGSDEKYRLAANGTGATGQNVGMTSNPADEATGVVQATPAAMNIMNPWYCVGYMAVHTGQTNHDYMGVIT